LRKTAIHTEKRRGRFERVSQRPAILSPFAKSPLPKQALLASKEGPLLYWEGSLTGARMSPRLKKTVVVVSLLVVAYALTGRMLMGRSSTEDKTFRALTVYSEVLEHIQRDYVDEPNIPAVTNGALHGLLDSLDPQSAYLSPLEYKDYKEKTANNPGGEAGMALTRRFGYIGVISVLPDSPAAKAGLRIGDILEKIGGFTSGQMAIDQAQLLLKGAPGTVVKLSAIRRGKAEPQEMDITLAKLAPPKLVEDKLQGDIAYLHVPEFTAGTTGQIKEALARMQQKGAKKLILDLRDCALGDEAEGISTAQLFVPSGTITTLKGQTVAPVVYSADPAKVAWSLPVAVLIGNGTAGPAEIVASAIADNKRGDTVGERTYGIASQQKLIEMDNGSALILTTALYYTPGGKNIPAEGIAPTEEIHPSMDSLMAANDLTAPTPLPSASPDDPDMKKAIEILESGAAPGLKKAA
jgi:carboxyl-terminal processing protease